MASLELMKKTAEIVNSDPKLKSQMKGPLYIQFQIEGEPPFYMEIASDGTVKIVEGKHGSPAVTLIAKDAVMVGIIKGELDPVRAYLKGELKISGDVFIAQRIGSILSQIKGRL
ncbi:MAG: SCP2 sterol-binding domain-containing protein [Sulfolobales archaeon]